MLRLSSMVLPCRCVWGIAAKTVMPDSGISYENILRSSRTQKIMLQTVVACAGQYESTLNWSMFGGIARLDSLGVVPNVR